MVSLSILMLLNSANLMGRPWNLSRAKRMAVTESIINMAAT
ncbi:hypothetical protein SDC9_198904 [bioreactor metagenome]|uniref:Uncharacterized protein n=1 Tax=bioreactor metagenome TaxID=1076179 RepID=A0A645IJ02_9ZZZZ